MFPLILLCLFLLFQFCVYDATPISPSDYLRPNESISDGQILVSAGNNYAFGFFSPGNSSYRYVGIWYYKVLGKSKFEYKVAETSVVWVANRDNPIKNSSGFLSLGQDGNLVVSSHGDQKCLWSTNVSLSSNSTFVRLLNFGNLILYSGNTHRLLWQSFDHPTHMLLPGMKLGIDRRTNLQRFLISWKSKDDPGRGIYSFKFNSRGRCTELFLYKGSTPIWRSGPWNGQRFNGMPLMNTYLYRTKFVDNSEELYSINYMYNSLFSPYMLNYFGEMQRMTWIEKERRWSIFYSTFDNECEYYGYCNAYGSCRTEENTVECVCLPSFQPKSQMHWSFREWSDGCVRKRSLGCGKGDGFLKLVGLKLPDTSMALVNKNLSLDECKQECFKNCSCTAYAPTYFTGGGSGCIAWFGNLMDIRYFSCGGDYFHLRVDAVELAEHARKDGGFLHNKRTLVILIVSPVVVVLLFATFVYQLLKKRRGTIEKQKRSRFLFDFTSSTRNFIGKKKFEDIDSNAELPFVELQVVATATDNFSPSNKLGQGGFGVVYKGRLSNGKQIAVKRLSRNSGQGIEEFKNEVLLIAKLQHRNLVSLLACCVHEEEKILIYEFMPNNSLDSFIFDDSKKALLDWIKRFEIIVGIARDVLYLHQDSKLRIIHRDLKACNVLLDEEMNPKISDFGMARIFGGNQEQENTRKVVGTYGYMSPEYAMQGLFSIKSDVFSFGVLLIEIISGKRNCVYFHDDASTHLIEHVWELWKEGNTLEIVDSSMGDSYLGYEVSRCIQIGLLCVQQSPSDRPTMSSVIFMLENEIEMSVPSRPPLLMQRTLNDQDTLPSINGVIVSDIEPR